MPVKAIKGTVAKAAKTPARFLQLIANNTILDETKTFANNGIVTAGMVPLLAIKQVPDESLLLSLLKEKFKKAPPYCRWDHGRYYMDTEGTQEDLDVVKFLVDSMIGVNNRDGKFCDYQDTDDFMPEGSWCGATALHYAAFLQLSHICRLLLDSPNFTEADAVCRVPLYDNGHICFTQDGCTAFHAAVVGAHYAARYAARNRNKTNDWRADEVLLNHPRFSNVHAATRDGWTALHFAADLGNLQITKLLVEQCGLDMNTTNSDGRTATDVAFDNVASDDVEDEFSRFMQICTYLGEQGYQYLGERGYQGRAVDLAKYLLRYEADEAEDPRKDDRGAFRIVRRMKGKQRDAQRKQRIAEKKHKDCVERHARGIKGQHPRGPDPTAAAGRLLLERALSFSIDVPLY